MEPPRRASGLTSRLRLSLIIIWSLSVGTGASSERVERRLATMGTILRIAVTAPDRPGALAASEAAAREVERVDRLLSTWRPDGPLDRLNRAPAGQAVAVGTETERLLTEILAWSQRTGGAFDPTVLPLVRAWDLRGAGRIPAPAELASALAAVGPENFRLDQVGETAIRLSPAAGIDEGAWGKGYALDRAMTAAAAGGAAEILLDLGGQILARGRSTVLIADPKHRERAAVSMVLENSSLSTSGNSERGKTVAGRRIGHLLDPRTGRPAPDFGSASVLAPSGLVADVLSTAFFVLGPRRGLELSESLRRQGFSNEVLFLIAKAGGLERVASPHFSFQTGERSR
jgi:FAD:protein FMN transferase